MLSAFGMNNCISRNYLTLVKYAEERQVLLHLQGNFKITGRFWHISQSLPYAELSQGKPIETRNFRLE